MHCMDSLHRTRDCILSMGSRLRGNDKLVTLSQAQVTPFRTMP
jgi:hypothetical protein